MNIFDVDIACPKIIENICVRITPIISSVRY
jgi:hypothetical protein